MAILNGAVAYRIPPTQEEEQEINTWDLRKPGSKVLVCQKCGCAQYGMIVEINASDDVSQAYERMMKDAMQRDCHRHPRRINVNR